MKTPKKPADRIRERVAKVVNRAVRTTEHAIGNRSAADIAMAAELPQGEAPMYLHMSKALSAAVIKSEHEKVAPSATTLNLVFLGQKADSMADWLASARSTGAAPALPVAREVIEVEALEEVPSEAK